MHETTVKYKKPNAKKLRKYGFVKKDGLWNYQTFIAQEQLQLTVSVMPNGNIRTSVTDLASGGEYVLHLAAEAAGPFVGMVRADYEAILAEIVSQCFESDVFKSDGAKKAAAYVRAAYGDELEFLWERFPENAVWRRKDSGKWYGALLLVSKRKLGFDSDDMAEILDLRIEPADLEHVLDGRRYLPGYHMNKKHWYTICLDGSVPSDEIFQRIDESYRLAKK